MDPPLIEDIDPGRVITVNWSAGWSMVTLICKDFLDFGLIALLAQLRPSFVFVVAFSDSTALFEANATTIATNCQATVVVCNFVPGSTTHPSATVALPLSNSGRPAVVTAAASGVLGKLALLDLVPAEKAHKFQLIEI